MLVKLISGLVSIMNCCLKISSSLFFTNNISSSFRFIETLRERRVKEKESFFSQKGQRSNDRLFTPERERRELERDKERGRMIKEQE